MRDWQEEHLALLLFEHGCMFHRVVFEDHILWTSHRLEFCTFLWKTLLEASSLAKVTSAESPKVKVV